MYLTKKSHNCNRTGCRNKISSMELGCSIECIGWIMSASKCTNLLCKNYTRGGRVCYICYKKNKGVLSMCLTNGCSTRTYGISCQNCSDVYYKKNKICLNKDCDNKTSLKYCKFCYDRHKTMNTPLHRCIKVDCYNQTYINLKYCESCHTNYKKNTKSPEEKEFTLSILLNHRLLLHPPVC